MTYSFDEFLAHLDAMEQVQQYESVTHEGNEIDIGAAQNLVFSVLRTQDYMGQLYDDPHERAFKADRFVRIMRFLADHIDDLDAERLFVPGSGESGSLVNRCLLQVLHERFTMADPPAGVTVREIVQLTRAVAEKN